MEAVVEGVLLGVVITPEHQGVQVVAAEPDPVLLILLALAIRLQQRLLKEVLAEPVLATHRITAAEVAALVLPGGMLDQLQAEMAALELLHL
jgi:hypothetical protein